jgi:hypothetical protein
VSDIHRGSQAVLDGIKENDLHVWSVEKTMGSPYTFPRWLFWRRWQPKSSKLSHHFFLDLVQELFNSTLYITIVLTNVTITDYCVHSLDSVLWLPVFSTYFFCFYIIENFGLKLKTFF